MPKSFVILNLIQNLSTIYSTDSENKSGLIALIRHFRLLKVNFMIKQ